MIATPLFIRTKMNKKKRGTKRNTVRDAVSVIFNSGAKEGDIIEVYDWNRVSRTVWHVLVALGYCEFLKQKKKREYIWYGVNGIKKKWYIHDLLMETESDQTEYITHMCMYTFQLHASIFFDERQTWTFNYFESKFKEKFPDINQRRIYDVINTFVHIGLLKRYKVCRTYRWVSLN